MSIFYKDCYKNILKEFFYAKEQRGVLSRAANFVKCQASYISRILGSSENITPDQAFELCKFFKLSPSETEYFCLLVDYERAGGKDLKRHLKRRLESKRKENLKVSELIKSKYPSKSLELEYFSSWIWSAIHFSTSIGGGQSLSQISKRLEVDEKEVSSCLEKLKSCDLVKEKNELWTFNGDSFHIPESSSLSLLFHQSWRLKAIQRNGSRQSSGLHCSFIKAVSKEAMKSIQQNITETIKYYDSVGGSSNPETLVNFNLDL
jgi:uncharacterized protein (TIGR02147 family)